MISSSAPVRPKIIWIALFCIVIAIESLTAQTPLGTAFTYQGTLNIGVLPANGNFDFEFRLFDAETDGVEFGSPVTRNNVPVANGTFTVGLDFGAGAFGEVARWLQIAVQPVGGGGLTTLTPRQRVTPAPAAVFAATAGNIGGIAPGTVPNAERSFIVSPGESVAAGQAVSFSPGTSTIEAGYDSIIDYFLPPVPVAPGKTVFNPKVARINDTTFLGYSSHDNLGLTFIGTVHGRSVTMGPEVPLILEPIPTTHKPQTCAAAGLPSGHLVIAGFFDEGLSKGNYIHPGLVNGNQPRWGLQVPFDATLTGVDGYYYFAITPLSDNKFAAAYVFNQLEGRVVIGEVVPDGTYGVTATVGTPVPFNTLGTNLIGIAALSPTQIAVVYKDDNNSGHGTARLGTISGNTVSFGNEKVFNASATQYPSVAALPGGRCLIVYADIASGYDGLAIVGAVSGDEFVFNDPAVPFNTVTTNLTDVSVVSSRTAHVYYFDVMRARGRMLTADITGSSPFIAFPSSPRDFFGDNIFEMAATPLNDQTAVFLYTNNSILAFLTAGFADPQPVIGIARGAGNAGESVPVQLLVANTVAGGFSGLTVGADYFAQTDGSVSTDSRGTMIGVAVSASELLLLP